MSDQPWTFDCGCPLGHCRQRARRVAGCRESLAVEVARDIRSLKPDGVVVDQTRPGAAYEGDFTVECECGGIIDTRNARIPVTVEVDEGGIITHRWLDAPCSKCRRYFTLEAVVNPIPEVPDVTEVPAP